MLLSSTCANNSAPRALVLAGGGMRVAYQAGVLKALEEAGLQFQHVDGTSGGTINTAMLFSAISPDNMCERWRSLKVREFVSLLPLKRYFNPFKLEAFGDADSIINRVFPHLGIDVALINREQYCEATFNVCNFSKKQNIAFSHRDVTLEHLIAGISLPIFMPAININGDWYSDSVWIKDANLMEAVKRGAEEIWLVWCIGNSPDYKNGAFLQYVHMIEMSANGTLLEELDRINELNQRIANGDSPYGQKKQIKLHVIKPSVPLPLDPAFYMGRINAHELIDIGYQNAKQYLEARQEAGIAMDWRATAMPEPQSISVMRQVYCSQTQQQKLSVSLRLRAEVIRSQSSPKLQALYGDITLSGIIKDQPLASGCFNVNGDGSLSFEAAFEIADKQWQIKGAVSTASLWQMLLGVGAKLHLHIYCENVRFDEAFFTINLWQFLSLRYQTRGLST